MSTTKVMCSWCKRGPHKPHLQNCPNLTGIQPRSNLSPQGTLKRTGAYLRRPRGQQNFLPYTLYLAETRTEPDSPRAVYEEIEALT